MMRGLLLAVFLLQAAVPSGELRGTVLTADGKGLRDASIELTGPRGNTVVRTDDQGRFVFSNLADGAYRVLVKKEGYVRQEPDRPILVAGRTPVDLVFRLEPAATIAGIVRNEDSFPLGNILVRAMRRTYDARGNRTFVIASSALTDDLGNFRLYWIDPGDYVVDASYLPQLPTPVNANEAVQRGVYAPTYYPGVAEAALATVIRLKHGEQVGRIDFNLQRSTPLRVRGTIYSVQNGDRVPARVMLGSTDVSFEKSFYSTQTDARGDFELKGVNPGVYVLSATTLSSDGQTGFSKKQFGGSNETRADLQIGPGVKLPIRIFGQLPPSADLRSMVISLEPKDVYQPVPKPSVLQPNGTLIVAGVQPGEYLVHVGGLPDNAYLQAAQVDQRDVLENLLTVQYERVFPLDIQLAADGGQITGSVADLSKRAVSNATVVLVPENSLRHRPDAYRVTLSEQDGTFAFRGVRPGVYKLFAWSDVEGNAWKNADFMQDYEESGTVVTVAPNGKVSAGVRILP